MPAPLPTACGQDEGVYTSIRRHLPGATPCRTLLRLQPADCAPPLFVISARHGPRLPFSDVTVDR